MGLENKRKRLKFIYETRIKPNLPTETTPEAMEASMETFYDFLPYRKAANEIILGGDECTLKNMNGDDNETL